MDAIIIQHGFEDSAEVLSCAANAWAMDDRQLEQITSYPTTSGVEAWGIVLSIPMLGGALGALVNLLREVFS
jgi:hypothetical protein